jgi:two-component system, OmpR family, response regulator
MAPTSIVLIEDSPVFMGLFTAFIEHAQPRHFEIAGTARSGAEGLAVVARLQPAAVIVDIKLPDISGLDVISRLRAKGSAVAIVALTNADPAAFRAPTLAAGADAFVPKEKMHAELLPALHGAVRARTNTVASEDHVDG